MRNVALSFVVLALSFSFIGCHHDAKDRDRKGGSEGFMSSSDWKAWVNAQPPGPKKLIVTGNVKVEGPVYMPSLKFDSLSKSDPPILNLRVVVERVGTQPTDELVKSVRYEDKTNTDVKKVHVTDPDGTGHDIDVGTAQ